MFCSMYVQTYRAEPGISIESSRENFIYNNIIISLEVVYVNHIDGGVRGR